tara:strand:- start:1266 stop:2051 length:786 start_codon:yes stop_codon:yes gene_type:complete
MNRLDRCFEALKSQKKAAFIPFITAGDPSLDVTLGIMHALVESGSDMIELGIPFSDPMADGSVIQLASERAIKSGVTVTKILDLVTQFRDKNTTTPIILMGYFNPIFRYGAASFLKDAYKAGVDGLIVVDLPYEHEQELHSEQLPLIKLITPMTEDDRLKRYISRAKGFIYYVSVAGVTGSKQASLDDLKKRITHIRQFTSLPIVVGFGIKTAQQVRDVSQLSDGVVVGSALVEHIAKQDGGYANAAAEFVLELSSECKYN